MKAYAQKKNQPQQQSSPNIRRLSPMHLAAGHEVHPITRLQRTIGNQAVQRLLRANAEHLKVGSNPSATNRNAHDFSRRPAHSEAPVALQAKLPVNTPGDKHEQEADRVANEVVSRITTNKSQVIQRRSGEGVEEATPLVQRQAVAGESSVGAQQEASIQNARGGGQPIAEHVRGPVEQTMGVNLSGVRVHDNAEADTLNRSLDARAFTTGTDIFFKRGEYNPASTAGQKLLVHELTHVVQQNGGSQVVQRDGDKGKVKQVTGKDVDTFLDTNVFIKKYVEEKVKKGMKAEGHVHIHKPEEFVKVWVKYATGKRNPDTQKVFTEAEIKNFETNVRGFRDRTEIHVHEVRGDSGTTIHESIHLFQDDNFQAKVGDQANEGTTEYFTQMIGADKKIDRGESYGVQLKSIKKLLAVTTKETLAAAYFQGKVDALEKAVEGKGIGTFAKWIVFMNAGKYSDADAMLAPAPAKKVEPSGKPK